MRVRCIVVLSVFLAAGACDPRASGDPAGPDLALAQPPGPVPNMTQEGCEITPGCWDGESDPDPEAPGYWLGATVTPSACYSPTGAGISDRDRDSFDDNCEFRLADRFSPELAYWSGDDLSRETRWAAKPLASNQVRIIFLLAYYVDLGSEGHPCCDGGHYGDSEYIVLDLLFNDSSKHWVLTRAFYSQHGSGDEYSGGPGGYPVLLQYPDHPGGYPRSYVAGYKHANYASSAECDAGGPYGLPTDWCVADSFERVSAPTSANIGSRFFHTSAQDCASSANPIYAGNGVVECFWTVRRFSGWQGLLPDSDPYEPVLALYAF